LRDTIPSQVLSAIQPLELKFKFKGASVTLLLLLPAYSRDSQQALQFRTKTESL
jgi:hypothetical protein